MTFRYKRFYLTGTVSLVLIFSLITGFIQYYDNYDDEVYCKEYCWVTFCMKNGLRNLDFYNKQELPLTFEPSNQVNDVKFYKKDGRFKSGYRPIDFIKPYTKGRKYVFRIPAYSYTCYAMNITKEAWSDVKWSFLGLDPMLISAKEIDGNIIKELCNPVYKTWTENISHYKTCTTTHCIYQSIENESECSEREYDCLDYIEEISHINEQIDCKLNGGIELNGKNIRPLNTFCKLEGTNIRCYSNLDGGQYAITWREDDSVDVVKFNIITEEITAKGNPNFKTKAIRDMAMVKDEV